MIFIIKWQILLDYLSKMNYLSPIILFVMPFGPCCCALGTGFEMENIINRVICDALWALLLCSWHWKLKENRFIIAHWN